MKNCTFSSITLFNATDLNSAVLQAASLDGIEGLYRLEDVSFNFSSATGPLLQEVFPEVSKGSLPLFFTDTKLEFVCEGLDKVTPPCKRGVTYPLKVLEDENLNLPVMFLTLDHGWLKAAQNVRCLCTLQVHLLYYFNRTIVTVWSSPRS